MVAVRQDVRLEARRRRDVAVEHPARPERRAGLADQSRPRQREAARLRGRRRQSRHGRDEPTAICCRPPVPSRFRNATARQDRRSRRAASFSAWRHRGGETPAAGAKEPTRHKAHPLRCVRCDAITAPRTRVPVAGARCDGFEGRTVASTQRPPPARRVPTLADPQSLLARSRVVRRPPPHGSAAQQRHHNSGTQPSHCLSSHVLRRFGLLARRIDAARLRSKPCGARRNEHEK